MIVQWRALVVLLLLSCLVAAALYRFANWEGLSVALGATALGTILALWGGVARGTHR